MVKPQSQTTLTLRRRIGKTHWGLFAVIDPEDTVTDRLRRSLALELDIINGFQIGNMIA